MRATEADPAGQIGIGTLQHYGLLTAILAAAALLRLIHIDSQGLWGDEGLTLALVHWPLKTLLLEPVDPTPALYYALHKAVGLPPNASAGAIRGVAFACGLLAIATIYAFGRLALGKRAGLLAAALLAVWPQHVDHSQEARSYALLFLLTLASATSLLWWHRAAGRASTSRRRLALAGFVLTTALAFYAHLVAVFWIFLALQIFALAALKHEPRRLREALVAVGAMAVLAIPGLIRIARQFGVPTNFNWLKQATAPEFLEKTASVLLPFESWWARSTFVAAAVCLGCFARRRSDRNREGLDMIAQLILLAFLFLPVLIWGFGFSIRPIFMERTILFAIPGTILAILAVVHALPERRLRTLASLAAVAAIGSTLLTQGLMRPREDWRGAYGVLARDARAGDLILLCAWQFPSLRHAADRPLDVPLVNYAGASPMMFERRLGERSDWDRLFFRYDIVPVTRHVDAPFQQNPVGIARGGRLWLVESDCPPESRANIKFRFGDLGWRRHWASAPTKPARPEVALFRKEAATDIVLPVLAPPEILRGPKP